MLLNPTYLTLNSIIVQYFINNFSFINIKALNFIKKSIGTLFLDVKKL